MQSSSIAKKASSATRDFSLRFEMTAGAASRPSPCREQRDFSLALEMTRKMLEMARGKSEMSRRKGETTGERGQNDREVNRQGR
jgi:cell division septum initiation protein DivIVA